MIKKYANVSNSRKGKFYFSEDVIYVFDLYVKQLYLGQRVENSIRAKH